MVRANPDELSGEIQKAIDDEELSFNLGKIPEGVARRSWGSAIYYIIRDRWGGSRYREGISVRKVEEREEGGWRVTISHAIERDYHSQYDSSARGTVVVVFSPDLGVLGKPEWDVEEWPYTDRKTPDTSASAEALKKLRPKDP